MGPSSAGSTWPRCAATWIGGGRGAELVVDGRGVSHGEGYFIGRQPVRSGRPEMRIYREEIFGPVLAIVRAPDYETALKLINEHGTATAPPSSPVTAIPQGTSPRGFRSVW